jgi:hypothetical protein
VVYIVGYAGEDTSRETAAAAAAALLDPEQRPGAVILMLSPENLSCERCPLKFEEDGPFCRNDA